mgnify:CR=1 FL=1
MSHRETQHATAQSARDASRGRALERPERLMHVAHWRGEAEHAYATLECKVLRLGDELDRAHRETVRMLIRIAAHRDDESAAHVRRIGLYAAQLAQRMGLDAGFCSAIAFAAQLHDIGKIGIADRILEKSAPLAGAECKVMKTHCALGAAMLSHHSSPYLAMAADIARAHHENWDGSGYPHRLNADAIPLAARITRLCDSYDVLRSRRASKLELPHRVAVQALLGGDAKVRPRCFDPAVLAAFESSLDAFREIFATVRD